MKITIEGKTGEGKTLVSHIIAEHLASFGLSNVYTKQHIKEKKDTIEIDDDNLSRKILGFYGKR